MSSHRSPSRVLVPVTAVAVVAGLFAAPGLFARASSAGPDVTATQAAPRVSTGPLFRSVLPRVKRRTDVPVLLPSSVPAYVPASRLTASGSGSTRRYSLALASAPRCGGATACFVGSFSGRRGARPDYRRRVRLAGRTTGYFKPLTCGASCSPPVVQWMRRGVLYEIAYSGASRSAERGVLTGLANSAIRAGAR